MSFLHRLRTRRRRPKQRVAFRPGAEGLEPRIALSSTPIGVSLDYNWAGVGNPIWTDLHNVAFNKWSPAGTSTPMTVSADGYPLENGSTNIAVTNDPVGNYQFSYTGSGTVSFSNYANLVGPLTVSNGVTTGTVAISHTDLLEWSVSMTVTGVNPANPMDNFHLMLPGYGNGTTPEPMFTPQFLQSLTPFSDIRFLNWDRANFSTVSNWSDRVQPNAFFTNQDGGVPYEDMIELANESQKDMWINIPALATPQFVQSLAQLVQSKLDSNLNVYFEYSNEVWNGAFSAYHQAAAAALNNPVLDHSLGQYQLVAQQAAYSLLADAQIFDQVFGSGASRVRPILGGQASWTQFQQYELQFIQQTYGAPSNYIYATSVAPYFGYGGPKTSSQTLTSVFANMEQRLKNIVAPSMKNDAAVAKQYGVRLVAYEGGPALVLTAADLDSLQQAQNDPRMYQIFREYIADWQAVGGGLFDLYQLTNKNNSGGLWGILTNVTDAGSQEYDAIVSTLFQPGDASMDGSVDYADFQALAANYGEGNAYWSQGSFNDDGTVNWADLNILRQGLSPGGFTLAQFAQQAVFGQPATVDAATALEYDGYGVTYAGALAPTATTGTVKGGTDSLGNPIVLNGVSYAQGLGMTGGSLTAIALNGAYARFDATIGVDGDGSSASSVVYQVYGDGSLLYQSPVESSGSAGVPIDVGVAGVQKLTLVVEAAAGSTAANDHAVWGDARLISTANFGAAPPYALTWQVSQDGQVISTQTGDSYVLPAVSGSYSVTVTADAQGDQATASTTVTVVGDSPSASLLLKDTGTKGNWIGYYGGQGYSLAGGAAALPSYASVAVKGASLTTWADDTTDPRAASEADGVGALAEAWSGSTLTIAVNLGDAQVHDLAIYAVDWNSQGRNEMVQVLSGLDGSVLDTQFIGSFVGGELLQWTVTGNVVIRVTDVTGPNAVVSGVFLDAPPATPSGLTQVDGDSLGNWVGRYGSQGEDIPGQPAHLPSYATITPSGVGSYLYASSTTDPRGLETPSGSSRTASEWWAYKTFTFNVALTDQQTHELTIYVCDWNETGCDTQIALIDPVTGGVLGTRTIWSYGSGEYLQWTISGSVEIQVTGLSVGGSNIGGIFLDSPTSNPAGSASFVRKDATTSGNWVGAYGGQGYDIEGTPSSLPPYATVNVSGASTYTTAASTTDARALEPPSGATTRSSKQWFGWSFTVDVNLSDGQAHLLSIYALDWGYTGRTEQIQLLDPATGQALDTENISSFGTGVYVQWKVTGHVQIAVTCTGGPNAAISGFFLDGTVSTAAASTYMQQDATTSGSWVGAYGGQGYDIEGTPPSLPPYATVNVSGASTYTAAASTTDARALESPSGGATRSSQQWTSSSFTVDVNLSDAQAHLLSIYALDWGYTGRSERLQVIDPATGKVLDTENISSFGDGVYVQWQVTGHVQVVVTCTGGPNADISGIFLDAPPS